MHPLLLGALYRLILFLVTIMLEVSVIGALILHFVYGFGYNPYASGGLLCCAVLLGWWGYYHGRGPDEGVPSA